MSNGKPGVTIDVETDGVAWLRFVAGQSAPPPDDLPLWLERAMRDWFENNAGCVPRIAVPTVVNGNTVAITVWYETLEDS